uniref:Uncharacterized protein n=1 Tax=Arion vulgaris TaxID=1028688 RepID=A0A0B7BRE6_9EUPU
MFLLGPATFSLTVCNMCHPANKNMSMKHLVNNISKNHNISRKKYAVSIGCLHRDPP